MPRIPGTPFAARRVAARALVTASEVLSAGSRPCRYRKTFRHPPASEVGIRSSSGMPAPHFTLSTYIVHQFISNVKLSRDVSGVRHGQVTVIGSWLVGGVVASPAPGWRRRSPRYWQAGWAYRLLRARSRGCHLSLVVSAHWLAGMSVGDNCCSQWRASPRVSRSRAGYVCRPRWPPGTRKESALGAEPDEGQPEPVDAGHGRSLSVTAACSQRS
jgi:hypothetical protein